VPSTYISNPLVDISPGTSQNGNIRPSQRTGIHGRQPCPHTCGCTFTQRNGEKTIRNDLSKGHIISNRYHDIIKCRSSNCPMASKWPDTTSSTILHDNNEIGFDTPIDDDINTIHDSDTDTNQITTSTSISYLINQQIMRYSILHPRLYVLYPYVYNLILIIFTQFQLSLLINYLMRKKIFSHYIILLEMQ
jgi:hypothetical protein